MVSISSGAGHSKYTDADAVKAVEAENTLAFGQATEISTTSGDLSFKPQAAFLIEVGALSLAVNIQNAAGVDYYTTDTRTDATGATAHKFDAADPTLVSASGATFSLAQFKAHTVNFTGTTQVTDRGIMIDIGAQSLVGASALTIDDWDGLRVVAPTEGSNVTLTNAVALHIINAGGSPTNQYGLLIDDLTAGGTDYGIAWTNHLLYSGATFAFQESTTISTTTGDLLLDPSGSLDFNGNIAKDIAQVRGRAASDLRIVGNTLDSNATARRVTLETIDTAGNTKVLVGYIEPTATETTPFWAQRADVTTPLTSALDASFLTFKWDPADDSVTVYVNDGGTIRSVSIGTVV